MQYTVSLIHLRKSKSKEIKADFVYLQKVIMSMHTQLALLPNATVMMKVLLEISLLHNQTSLINLQWVWSSTKNLFNNAAKLPGETAFPFHPWHEGVANGWSRIIWCTHGEIIAQGISDWFCDNQWCLLMNANPRRWLKVLSHHVICHCRSATRLHWIVLSKLHW